MGGSKIVIVGAGFAGAATAAALVARGVTDITILEAEPLYGAHASGKNAAMARRVIEDPLMSRLATEGLAGIVALGDKRGLALLRAVGGMIIGSEADVARLWRGGEPVAALAADMARLTMAEASERVPVLRGRRPRLRW